MNRLLLALFALLLALTARTAKASEMITDTCALTGGQTLRMGNRLPGEMDAEEAIRQKAYDSCDGACEWFVWGEGETMPQPFIACTDAEGVPLWDAEPAFDKPQELNVMGNLPDGRLVIQAVSADTEWRISGGTRARFLLCPEDGSMQPVPDEYALLKRTDVAVNLFDGGVLVRKLFDLDAAAYEAAFAWYDFEDGGLSERWRVSHPTLRGLWGNEVSAWGDSLLFAGLDVLRGEEGMHGAVFLLDMADGSLRWAYRTEEAQDCTIRSVQFKDGRVYCAGNMTTGKENVPVEEAWIDVRFSLDARTGERLEDSASD